MNVFSNSLSTWLFPLISLLILFFSRFIYNALLYYEGNPEMNLKIKYFQMMYVVFSRILFFLVYTTMGILGFEMYSNLNEKIKGSNVFFLAFLFLWISYESIRFHYKGKDNDLVYLDNTSKVTKRTLRLFLNIIKGIFTILVLLILLNKIYIGVEIIKNTITINSLKNLIIIIIFCIFYKKLNESKELFFKVQDSQETNEILQGIRIVAFELIFASLIVTIAFIWNIQQDVYSVFLIYLGIVSVLFFILVVPLIEKNEESVYKIQIFDLEKKDLTEIWGKEIINKGDLVIIHEYLDYEGLKKGLTRQVIYNISNIYKIDIYKMK